MLQWLIALSLLSQLTYPGGGALQQMDEGDRLAAVGSQEIRDTTSTTSPSARLILEARKVSTGVILTVILESSSGIADPTAAVSREWSGPHVKRTGSIRQRPIETVIRGMRLLKMLLLILA